MTVQEGPGGKGTKIIRTEYPVEEGLTAGTTKQTGDRILIPEESSLLKKADTILM